MAKLNVVIPTTDVEVIGKDGARTKYRKVERAAKAGDVIKITDSDATSYVIEGAFYEVKRLDLYDDPQIIGEDGDEFDAAGVGYEVYEKVAEPAQIKYREVKRPAKVGERIKIVNAITATKAYANGDEMTVKARQDIVPFGVVTGEQPVFVYDKEYVVLEPIDERLTVGDIVKTLDENGFCKIGDIVKIVEDDGSGVPYRLESLSGEYAGWLLEDDVVRATEAEVAAAKEAIDPRSKFAKGDKVRLVSGGGTPGLFDYETGGIYTVSDPKYFTGNIEITGGGQPTAYAKPEQLEKVSAEEFAEIEKWAAIGRKVNEYKPGDLIKVKRNSVAAGVISGEFGEVREVDACAFGNGVRLTKLNPIGIHAWVGYDDIELIIPVEQRFDREGAA